MFPIEFVVQGTAVSHRTRNKPRLRQWKNTVSTEARSEWKPNLPPFNGELEFRIVYFYTEDSPDTDNLTKPIHDALTGIIYFDDKQIVSAHCDKIDMEHLYTISNPTSIILLGLKTGEDFVHIKIQKASNPRVIL